MLINSEPPLKKANDLVSTVQTLRKSLETMEPDNSWTTQTITYALVGTALVGIMVYHYIKSQEAS